MKKLTRWIVTCLSCFVLGAGAVLFGPELYTQLFGGRNTQWISEQLSEKLIEQNQLLVYEVETSGIERVSQEAWLIGTVQKVELPYTFRMNFSVDLSQAKVETKDGLIVLSVPAPVPGYQKLTVDEEHMRKTDWLYPLTPERYAQIKNELEAKLFHSYSENETCHEQAWQTTVSNLQMLFESVASQSMMGETCEILIEMQTAAS